MLEKRKFVRFKAPAYCKCLKVGANADVSGMCKDMSMGGVKIIFDRGRDIKEDIVLEVFILLPDKTVKSVGKIVWVKEYDDKKEAGIKFINISDTYKEDIYGYIFKYYREEVTRHWWDA
ncbi:MAG: PilZ domain-containing protein [Candidatus Omnitrophica bacterium]|jgi:c-di-GMP-binding flagellar brake protein YcgR|nr:PilZ domain-containing protein [Candidatus Omnitrophota bacterium]MDD5081469.1 PilZ domain-containing protein [Candidatus Omnitrophota bacterium]MDD5441185.1 PilZ domain-containing protein [Candidatus Omnitrophota bacterium]